MPDFEFFEARSGAMQRKKVEIRGALSSFAARGKIVNSFLEQGHLQSAVKAYNRSL